MAEIARTLAGELAPGDRVLLEGPLGAGTSTFARALILNLGVQQPPEGSPTFAIAHEYQSTESDVIHIDFYRLRSDLEIDEAGIPAYFWERNAVVICEWLSLWPSFEKAVLGQSKRIWRVQLSINTDRPSSRALRIDLGGSA